MDIKVIIFDFDGVILNSEKRGKENMKRALEICGFSRVNRGLIDKYWGISTREIVKLVMGVKSPRQAGEILKTLRYLDLRARPYPSPFVPKSFFERLNSKYFLTILTGRDWNDFKPWFLRYGFRKYFGLAQTADAIHEIIGGLAVKRCSLRGAKARKPDPNAMRIHLRELKRFGFSAPNCVYLDDSLNNLKMMRGKYPVFVAVSRKDAKLFRNSGMPRERIIPSINSLPRLMEELRKNNKK